MCISVNATQQAKGMNADRIRIGSGQWTRILTEGAAELGVRLDDRQARLLCLHAAELLKWNSRVNLTRITEPVEVAVKHFLDSLAAVPLVGPGVAVLDLGSGGGFPGLPVKVAVPDARVTLLDSVRKKVSFLKNVIRQTGLAGIDAIQGRIEDLGQDPAHHRRYDVVISRALASLDGFAQLALPFVAPGGSIIALKGVRATGEVRDLEAQCRDGREEAGVRVVEIKEVTLPVLNLRRCIVVLKPVKARTARP
jgi:16S rRNA (guanine527-N7)-methyltransferase